MKPWLRLPLLLLCFVGCARRIAPAPTTHAIYRAVESLPYRSTLIHSDATMIRYRVSQDVSGVWVSRGDLVVTLHPDHIVIDADHARARELLVEALR